MKKYVLWACSFLVLLSAASPLVAQSRHYSNGPVWRVVYFDIKPGMTDPFWTDIKENLQPIFDDYKKQGWLVDYKFYTNPVAEHPGDWNVAVALEYKNWGTIDEMGEKATTLVEKHYGSHQASTDAGKKRSEYATVVRNSLAREVTLK